MKASDHAKSCHVRMKVVPAIPAETKATLTRMAQGQQTIAQGETT